MVKREKNIFDDSYQVGKGKEMVNQQFQGIYSVVKSNKTPLPLPKHWEVVTRHFEQCYEQRDNIYLIITAKDWASDVLREFMGEFDILNHWSKLTN